MKKKEVEIATNVSSGAEKVEVVEKKVKKSAKGDAAMGDSVNAEKRASKDKESEAANERVQRALRKKEEKEKRKSKKMSERIAEYKKYVAEENARIEKRLAEKKAKAEKHAAERKKVAEKRAAEKEQEARERARAKANRHQERSKKRTEKSNQERSKGYGGWIAAVVALGVTTLALASTVTVGAVEMSDMKSGVTNAQMGTMYELTGIMEHVDDDLDRARISVSPTQQGRILTDLLVQARLAESDLEKLPITLENNKNVTEFINRTGRECERMLAKLRAGEKLDEGDMQTLESLYKTNHSIRQELDGLIQNMKDKDLMDYVNKGKGMVKDALGKLENLTLEENRAALEGKMEGAGMRSPLPEVKNEDVPPLETARAEELCRQYFEKYSIDDFQCIGETVNRHYAAYNVVGYDDGGAMLFAEIDRKTGALITFDYYEEGNEENFDMDNALMIAEEFLEHLGYEDMEVMRVAQNGSTSDFTFVYEEDDILYYPDTVRVKICRTRGLVCGLDATKYLQNHRGRVEMNAKINMETAREMLNGKVGVETANLAVVNTAKGERLAYEFLCSYEENQYLIYLDANNGDEIAIINTQNLR